MDRGAYNPVVSPDGSWVAFGLLGDIWRVPIGGGTAEQLTSGYGWDHHPAWSPDGHTLAYVHDTPASSEILLRSFDTGAARTIHARSPGDVSGGGGWGPVYSFGHMAFHPTEPLLYFVDFRSGIRSVPLHRALPTEVLAGSERLGRPGITERSSFAFSPDGTRIVVERDTTRLWTHLHVARLDSLEWTVLTQEDSVRSTHVGWSPEGDRIVNLEASRGRESLVVRAADGSGAPTRIPLGPFNGRELALHPDGATAVLVSRRRLERVDLASGAVEAIPFEARLRRPSLPPADLVITNARVFDATGVPVREGVTVTVRDGRIASVSQDPPGGDEHARVIDAENMFLMPGLTEAHEHLWAGAHFGEARTLTRGITSVIDMGSYLPETLNLRDAIEAGELVGPTIYTAGSALDGPGGLARPLTIYGVRHPDVAREVVRELASNGVDLIKLYAFLEPDAARAAIDEAHTVGLPVVGDLVATPWSVAVDAGIDGLVHLMDHKWRFVSKEAGRPVDDPFTVIPPDSARAHSLFAQLADRDAMFDPTVLASSGTFRYEDFEHAFRPADVPPQERDTVAIRRTAVVATLLRALHDEGVRWVSGTDFSSFRLVDELEAYELIGISRATILETATANPARWLNRDDFGTIEPGKRADLILIDGDPLTRIADLRNVAVVIQRGRVVSER